MIDIFGCFDIDLFIFFMRKFIYTLIVLEWGHLQVRDSRIRKNFFAPHILYLHIITFPYIILILKPDFFYFNIKN